MRNVWTALGALAAGAAAMYLNDPEQGARRRALLRDRFATAADGAVDTLQNAGAQASDRLDEAAQDGRGLLQEVLNRVQDLAHQGRAESRQALREAEIAARDARDRLSAGWDGSADTLEPRRAGGSGGLLLAVSGIVVGAAAIYLLNSEAGRRRLADARERAKQLGQRITQRKEQSATDQQADDAQLAQTATADHTAPALPGNRPPSGASQDAQGGAALH